MWAFRALAEKLPKVKISPHTGELCEDLEADKAALCAALAAVGYEYDAQRNQFV